MGPIRSYGDEDHMGIRSYGESLALHVIDPGSVPTMTYSTWSTTQTDP